MEHILPRTGRTPARQSGQTGSRARLPVCPDCLAGVLPVRGKMCSICGERVLSGYAEIDPEGLRRCPVCRRIERPFERAVAYGSYEGGLRELIHLLKYNGVRPAAKV